MRTSTLIWIIMLPVVLCVSGMLLHDLFVSGNYGPEVYPTLTLACCGVFVYPTALGMYLLDLKKYKDFP